MPPGHVDELRVALRGPDRGGMADHPERQARNPEAQAQAECRRERAVQDRDAARCAAE
jgi:hypothetical protein